MQPQSAIDVERESWSSKRTVTATTQATPPSSTTTAARLHLVAAGYEVLRFTWRQVIDRPDEVVAAVRARLVPCLPSSAAVRR